MLVKFIYAFHSRDVCSGLELKFYTFLFARCFQLIAAGFRNDAPIIIATDIRSHV